MLNRVPTLFEWATQNTRLIRVAAIGCLLLALAGLATSFSENTESGVYYVQVDGRAGSFSGSAFLVSGDSILATNAHLIENARDIHILGNSNRSEPVSASVLWQDKTLDLALLETAKPLSGTTLDLATAGRGQPAKQRDVSAIGFPGIVSTSLGAQAGTDRLTRERLKLNATISTGTVQRLVPTPHRLLIQHSATIRRGNSGGPLLDGCSRVVGVNTLFVERETFQWAVHVNELIPALVRTGIQFNGSGGGCYGGYTIGKISWTAILLGLAAGLWFLPSIIDRQPSPSVFRDPAVSATGPIDHTSLLGHGYRLVSLQGAGNFDLNIPAGGGVSIGRIDGGADIEIADSSVSSLHFSIRLDRQGNPEIGDQNSTNGTKVNGRVIPPGTWTSLQAGDRIELGKTALQFTESVPSAVNLSAPAKTQASTQWTISGFDGNGKTIHAIVSASSFGKNGTAPFTIGRSHRCDLIIDDPSVSRVHAQLSRARDDGISVIDCASSNGTWLDGIQVYDVPQTLGQNASLNIGDVSLSILRNT